MTNPLASEANRIGPILVPVCAVLAHVIERFAMIRVPGRRSGVLNRRSSVERNEHLFARPGRLGRAAAAPESADPRGSRPAALGRHCRPSR
jgi:hypothetical protein